MSLLDQMRAEREANTAKAEARLGRFLGPGSGPAAPNVTYRCPSASANQNQKLSQNVNTCGQPATTDENQKLSQNRHNGAQLETTTHATGLPQNLQSRDGKRLASLLDQYRRGAWMEPATEQAVELTLAFGVSLRTAQRHVKRGTLPAQERRMGADGKQHPLSNGARVRPKTERELVLARQALARAARAAATDGIQVGERELLKQIQAMAAEMRKTATITISKRA